MPASNVTSYNDMLQYLLYPLAAQFGPRPRLPVCATKSSDGHKMSAHSS